MTHRCCFRPKKLVWSFEKAHLACLIKGLETQDPRILHDLSIRAAKRHLVEFLKHLLPLYDIDDYQVCQLMAFSRKSPSCILFLNDWLQGRSYPHLTYLCIDTLNVTLYLSTFHGWDQRIGLWLARRLRFQTLDMIIKMYDFNFSLDDETNMWIKTYSTEYSTAIEIDGISNGSLDRLRYYVYDPDYCKKVLNRRDFNIKMIRPHMTCLTFFGALWGGCSLSYLAYCKGHLNAMMFLGRHFGFSSLIPHHILKSKYRKHF